MLTLEEKLKKYGKEPLNLSPGDYDEIIFHLQFLLNEVKKNALQTIENNQLLKLINQAFPMR